MSVNRDQSKWKVSNTTADIATAEMHRKYGVVIKLSNGDSGEILVKGPGILTQYAPKGTFPNRTTRAKNRSQLTSSMHYSF